MERKNIEFKLLYFLIVPLIILTYVIIDYKTTYDSSVVKYSLMIVILLYVFIIGLTNIIKKKDIKISIFYMLAITFTLISDYYLLIEGVYNNLSISTFIIAHLMYSVMIYYSSSIMNKKWLIIEKSLILVTGVIVFIITKDLFTGLITIYGLCLVNNFIDSLILLIKTKELYALFLVIGFVLFIGCDICVLLYNLDIFLDESKRLLEIEDIVVNLIWIFYGPSQFFISLGINRGKKNEEESA